MKITYSLKAKFIGLVLLVVVLIGAFSFFTFNTLEKLSVNGPIYLRIVEGKDIVADVLPPPEYILESYMVALQMLEETDLKALSNLVARSARLKDDYVKRHEYWRDCLEEGQLKASLVETSYTHATNYYELQESEFLPAILAGDKEKARSLALGSMRTSYEAHRAAIDTVVTLANERSSADEQKGAGVIKWRRGLMIGLAGGCVLLVVLFVYVIARSITVPINRVIAGLDATSARLIGAAAELTDSSRSLADGAGGQASSLEETSASMEQLASMTRQNADNSNHANSVAVDACKLAEAGVDSMAHMQDAIERIRTSAAETARILKTIDEIAFQTNLLALNAAVEAARAGEAGKGFAVVAEEVRNLARRSADAAKQTAELVSGSLKNSDDGVAASSVVAGNLAKIKENNGTVATLIAEISSASKEQSSGIDQINTAVTEMDKVVQGNAATAEHISSSLAGLHDQAKELSVMVRELTSIVSGEQVELLENAAQV